jgi:hypothetical protein
MVAREYEGRVIPVLECDDYTESASTTGALITLDEWEVKVDGVDALDYIMSWEIEESQREIIIHARNTETYYLLGRASVYNVILGFNLVVMLRYEQKDVITRQVKIDGIFN